MSRSVQRSCPRVEKSPRLSHCARGHLRLIKNCRERFAARNARLLSVKRRGVGADASTLLREWRRPENYTDIGFVFFCSSGGEIAIYVPRDHFSRGSRPSNGPWQLNSMLRMISAAIKVENDYLGGRKGSRASGGEKKITREFIYILIWPHALAVQYFFGDEA